MKNFVTINQGNFIAIGKLKNIKIDTVDGLLFDWIQNFTNSQKALKKLIDNKLYIWVSYKAIREDNPMAHINTNDVVGRRLNKLVDLGLLEKYLSKEDGNKTFFHITEYAFTYLLESRELPTQKSEAYLPKSRELPTQKSDNSKLIDSYDSKLIDIKENKEKKPTSKSLELPPELNIEAFNMWIEYKGKSYSVQGKKISINKLIKYPKDVQLQMVENSIMNNYKGLFEVKSQNNQVSHYQQTQQPIDPFTLYTDYRNKGMDREVAETRVITETGMKYPATDRFLKATANAEYEFYMKKRAAQQQQQTPVSDEDYQEKLLKELYDEN